MTPPVAIIVLDCVLRGGAGRPPLSRRGALRGCAARGGGHGAAPVKRRLDRAQAAAPLARPHPRRDSGGGRRAAGRSLPPGGRPPTGVCAPPRRRRRADSRRRPPAARPAATGGCHSSGAGGRGRGRAAATRNFAGPAERCSAAPRRSPPQSFTPRAAGCGSDSSGTVPPSPAAPHGTRRREKGAGKTAAGLGQNFLFSPRMSAATPQQPRPLLPALLCRPPRRARAL